MTNLAQHSLYTLYPQAGTPPGLAACQSYNNKHAPGSPRGVGAAHTPRSSRGSGRPAPRARPRAPQSKHSSLQPHIRGPGGSLCPESTPRPPSPLLPLAKGCLPSPSPSSQGSVTWRVPGGGFTAPRPAVGTPTNPSDERFSWHPVPSLPERCRPGAGNGGEGDSSCMTNVCLLPQSSPARGAPNDLASPPPFQEKKKRKLAFPSPHCHPRNPSSLSQHTESVPQLHLSLHAPSSFQWAPTTEHNPQP